MTHSGPESQAGEPTGPARPGAGSRPGTLAGVRGRTRPGGGAGRTLDAVPVAPPA